MAECLSVGGTVAIPSSEFNRLFKADLARLFRRPKANADAIKDLLVRMVQYIIRGWSFPRREIIADVTQDVCRFVLEPATLAKVDASQNPAAWFRTTINREINARIPHYLPDAQELPEDATASAPLHDPMDYARSRRDSPDAPIEHFASRVRAAQAFDSEIDRLLSQYRDGEDYQVMLGIEAAIFCAQRLRKELVGEYKCVVVGTLRFCPDTFLRFAPKGER